VLETELPRGLALALVPELVLGLDRPGFGPPPVACCTPARMGDCCRYGCSCEVGASAIASAARLVEAVFGREVDPVPGMPWNVAERGKNGRAVGSASVSLQSSMTESLRDCGRDSEPPAEEPSRSRSSSSIPENGRFREMRGWSASAGGWKENGESYPPPTEGSVASEAVPYPDDERANSEDP
jgi:hypothetical protein